MTLLNSLKPKTPNVQDLLNELQTGTIKNHVTNCISEVSMDALEKLGANGGVIYDFEGGTFPFNNSRIGWEFLNHTYREKKFYVAYGVKQNYLCDKVNYSIPGYPYASTPFDQLDRIYLDNCIYNPPAIVSRYGGFYGEQVMSKLCSMTEESSCEPFAKGPGYALTIQKQLEDYVSRELPLCVNFSAFVARMPVDIQVTADPSIKSTIHNTDLLMNAKYPIMITFEGEKPITKIIDYQSNLKVRLGSLYNFLFNVLSVDTQNIGFDAVLNYTHSGFWKQGFELTKTDNPCLSCPLPYYHDDVVEVVDRKSLVNGKAFLFRAAVKNRRPAIDFMETLNVDLAQTNFIIKYLDGFDPDDISTDFYLLSLTFGEDRCRGTASAPPAGYVIQAFETGSDSGPGSQIEGVAPGDYPKEGLDEITGMAPQIFAASPNCPPNEQGDYAGNNFINVDGILITGYRLVKVGSTCFPACGPAGSAIPCPNIAGYGNVQGCAKGNSQSGRCIMSKSASTWESCFPPTSSAPFGDACVVGPSNEYFVPHGSYLDRQYEPKTVNYCMWTWEPDDGGACNCGEHIYDSSCKPSACVYYPDGLNWDCCDVCKPGEFCNNNKQDCGETGVDEGNVCDLYDCDSCTGCDGATPPPTGITGGWCERDPRVSNPATGKLLRSNLLWMPLEYQDLGNHQVAILAVDDSGLFDYQKFQINITDSRHTDPARQNCIRECIVEMCSKTSVGAVDCNLNCDPLVQDRATCRAQGTALCDWTKSFHTGKAPYSECVGWCEVAENACDSECADNIYVGWRCFPPGSGRTTACRQCVYNIRHSGDLERHLDCHAIIESGACISQMPNCFWIRENQSNTFVDSCFNDTSLHTANPPAYILFS